MRDFIIVGRGLAANVLAHSFQKHNISFSIIGKTELSSSSFVAAGIWNPIVFKRMTASWLAHQTVPFLLSFYNDCEERMNKRFVHKRNIIKPFVQEQEKQLWLKKSKNELSEFLNDQIQTVRPGEFKNCNIAGEYGLVEQSGNIDLPIFLNESSIYFKDHVVNDVFDYNELEVLSDHVSYKTIKARNIVFCEGHLVKNNPFFNWIPFKPAKGEVITISADVGLERQILNKGGFILKLAENTFKVGATYEWNDLTEEPTAKGLTELKAKLAQLVTSESSIINHEAGIRPSTIDRRPVMGKHPANNNIYIFNGLGTKGVMLAPFFANNFVFCYLQKQALNAEADVKRFYSLHKSAG